MVTSKIDVICSTYFWFINIIFFAFTNGLCTGGPMTLTLKVIFNIINHIFYFFKFLKESR